MELIPREEYLKKLIEYRNKRVIKVITGVRRCGKSTLLLLFQKYLKTNGIADNQIISLNFEDFCNFGLRDPIKLHSYILEKTADKGIYYYVFFDEIQQVTNFHEILNSLALRENIDIYVTGSNAYMLSGEIATYISGRYIEIRMLPFSFKEFRLANPEVSTLPGLYNKYATEGGLPYVTEMAPNPTSISDYLSGVYSTIVLKDIISRGKIGNPETLDRIVRFLSTILATQYQ